LRSAVELDLATMDTQFWGEYELPARTTDMGQGEGDASHPQSLFLSNGK